jgi:hypothetical protein
MLRILKMTGLILLAALAAIVFFFGAVGADVNWNQ